VNNNNEEGSETQYVAVSDILNEVKSANMVNGNPVTSDIDPCRFKDYTHPVTNVKKTKEVCEPEPVDEFTSLRRSSESSSDSGSGSDSGSDSDSDSDSKTNKKKREKREKKNKQNVHGPIPIASAGGAYDSMSITNDTMFDDVYHHIPDDTPTRIYYAAIMAIGLYLLYRLLEKKR
jgi:hypothetical protein